MTKKQKIVIGIRSRIDRLLPDGKPRWIRIYDAGCKFADRYTVIFSGNYPGRDGQMHVLAMGPAPIHPQGFCMHMPYDRQIDGDKWGFTPKIGMKNHLGIRIRFQDLPEQCKKIVMRDYLDIWGIHMDGTITFGTDCDKKTIAGQKMIVMEEV